MRWDLASFLLGVVVGAITIALLCVFLVNVALRDWDQKK